MKRFFIFIFVLITPTANALNIGNVNPTTIERLTGTAAEELIKIVSFGFDHRPYRAASPLGYLLGFDLGIELVAVSASTTFKQALKDVGVKESIPAYIPIPKLNLVKGLPLGLDISGSFVGYQSAKIWGVGAQWSFLNSKTIKKKGIRKVMIPSVAIRGAYNRTSLILVHSTTVSADLLVSLPLLLLFEPYIGVGHQRANGKIWVSAPASYNVPLVASGVYNLSTNRIFVGFPIDLLFLRITAHAERNTSGQQLVGLKAGFEF